MRRPLGFNIPFVWNGVGRSWEQTLSSNFPERLCFQIQGFMLHRVILSGMCPPSNPTGPSLGGGAPLNVRCTFMLRSGASQPWGSAGSVPETAQPPAEGAALKRRGRLQTSITAIIVMMLIVNLY